MEEIICLFYCFLIIIIIRIIFRINLKQAKKMENNKRLQNITNRFPENIEIAKEMLEIINNKNVKLEQSKNTKTSLYIAVTNKIVIADLKDNYGRIGTIAHECIHSIQDKMLLISNFIFSNLTIICWLISLVLLIYNVFANTFFNIFILLLLFFIQAIIRVYLEMDAMIKSKFLAKEYIESKKICTKEEENELISQYDMINKMGINFYVYKLITGSLTKIIIYIVIQLFISC